jgi:predicted RND superfamily exporter protein
VLRSLPSYLALGLILVFSVFGLRRLHFATDVMEVLPDGIPEVEAFQVLREYYDDDHRVLLLLGHEEEVFEEDAAEFTAYLRESLPEARIEYRPRFEDDPVSIAPSLARMWADSDPKAAADFGGMLLDPERLEGYLEKRKELIALSLDQGEATLAAYDPLGFADHPAMAQLRGESINHQSEDGTLWLVMIANPGLGINYRAHTEWVGRIREAAEGWMKDGFHYRLTGGPVFSAEVGAGMEKDMGGTIALTSLIVGLLFLFIQRSFGQLLALGGILGIVFVITLGLAGWILGTLNLVSVAFAAILLGLVIDYGVVIARESQPGQSPSSLRREMAPGILWAALTTAVVFGILILSTFKGVQELGTLVLIGLVVGAVVCLWLMPVALRKVPSRQPQYLLKPPFPPLRYAFGILIALVLGAGGAFLVRGLPMVDFDVGMANPKDSEAAITLESLRELFPYWSKKNLSLVAQGDDLTEVRRAVESAQDGIAELEKAGVITRAEWPVEILPDPEARQKNMGLWEKVSAKSDEILAAMDKAGFSDRGRALDAAVLRGLGEVPAELDSFTRLFYHPDGYFVGRIQLAERVDEENVHLVTDLNQEQVTVSGWGVLRLLLLKRVKADLYFLFIPATVVLLTALIAVFRSWKDAFLTAGVLLVVLLLVNALAVLSGRPWNFLSSMAIPLIVGTGIDYSIHLIFALRRCEGDFVRVWNGVGKGILFCGLSTVVGFGSLAFASNEMLQTMGIFCSVGVFLTMSLSVLVVPVVWQWLWKAPADAEVA